MAEPLPILVESSLQIAWDFLDGLGELADPQESAEFFLRNINAQILRGERRRLVLSNRAIELPSTAKSAPARFVLVGMEYVYKDGIRIQGQHRPTKEERAVKKEKARWDAARRSPGE